MTAQPADDGDFLARFSLSITRLARMLRQNESTRLTPTAAATLATIVRRGPITLGDLAMAEGISPSTVTKAVSKLERDDLIERVIDSDDRRVHRVRLSSRGRREINVYRSRRNAWLAEQIGLLDENDRAVLMGALRVLERLTASAGPDPVSEHGS